MRVDVEQIQGRRMAIRTRGLELIVDDTAEAGGPGDGFRPTELVLGALGTCMIGTLLTFARNEGIEVDDVTMHLEGEEHHHPERIGKISIEMGLKTDANDRRIKTLERVAKACKIHKTLERPPEFEFVFRTER